MRRVFFSILTALLATALAIQAGAQSHTQTACGNGTQRMAAALEWLGRTADPTKNRTIGSAERLTHLTARLATASSPAHQAQARIELAFELLFDGQTERAITEFHKVVRAIHSRTIVPTPDDRKHLYDSLVTAYLRLGEQENCITRHVAESCLFPLRGGALHTETRGSKMAIRELSKMLQKDPSDLASRWLLNLAYMTLGQWPERVPEQWRITHDTFTSDYEIRPFENVAPKLGLDVRGLAGGSILEDFDGDGHLDIMASAWGMREQLRYFHNDGDGTFSERTRQSGLLGQVGSLNLVHTDYNNDNRPDVFVLRGAWLGENGRHPNSLLRNNEDGTFADVTEEAGLLSLYPTQTAVWGDYNNDGWVDLFIGNESSLRFTSPCELYHNNGDGTFTEVAAQVGLAHIGFVKGAAWGDYDNDGRLDLFVSNLGEPNVLFRNDGPGQEGWSFTDVTGTAGVREPINSFPVWFWDYDNDGWQDLFVAAFPGFWGDNLAQIVSEYLGRSTTLERSALYRNQGDGSFRNVAIEARIHDVMLAMGANFGDVDNDGFPDVYVGTGEPHLHTLVPNRMYRNATGRVFQDITASGRTGHLQKGHGISFGDIDNDGDQDIYAVMGGAYLGDVAHNALFLNPGQGGRWITLQLEGVQSNRMAIGARIRVMVTGPSGERDIYATVGTGGSFGASSLQQEIGLGNAESLRGIEIRWPSGNAVQRIGPLKMNRFYRIREGDAEPTPLKRKSVKLAR